MYKLQRFFIISIFVFSFSVFADAQDIANYLFLEAVDSNGKPIKDASVGVLNFNWRDKRSKENWYDETPTDDTGKARVLITDNSFNFEFARPLFRTIKTGYYPFLDLGTKANFFRTDFKLELLKIPQTKEEEKAVGREQLKREFLWAARDGDAEKIRCLVKAGISPKLDTNDLRGISAPKNVPAIMFAAASGDAETVEIFLKAKVKVRAVENSEHSLLAYYLTAQPQPFWSRTVKTEEEKAKVMKEFERGVKILIQGGARLDNLNSDNANALMIAARYSAYTGIARMLLEKGLPINARDDKGETALYYANPYYNYEMIKLLLEAGADPNIVPRDDCSFLIKAISSNNFGSDNVDVIRLLVKHGANVNYVCKGAGNTLTYASRPEVKKLLQDAGAK